MNGSTRKARSAVNQQMMSLRTESVSREEDIEPLLTMIHQLTTHAKDKARESETTQIIHISKESGFTLENTCLLTCSVVALSSQSRRYDLIPVVSQQAQTSQLCRVTCLHGFDVFRCVSYNFNLFDRCDCAFPYISCSVPMERDTPNTMKHSEESALKH